jgi:predicted component of viral defense system (DUF524 family)
MEVDEEDEAPVDVKVEPENAEALLKLAGFKTMLFLFQILGIKW